MLEARKKEMEAELEEQLKRLDSERKEGLYRLDWELAEAIEALHAKHAERANKMVAQHRETISRLEKSAQAGEQLTPERMQEMRRNDLPKAAPPPMLQRQPTPSDDESEEESEEESSDSEEEGIFGRFMNMIGGGDNPVVRRPPMRKASPPVSPSNAMPGAEDFQMTNGHSLNTPPPLFPVNFDAYGNSSPDQWNDSEPASPLPPLIPGGMPSFRRQPPPLAPNPAAWPPANVYNRQNGYFS
jgi:hypothetical protein